MLIILMLCVNILVCLWLHLYTTLFALYSSSVLHPDPYSPQSRHEVSYMRYNVFAINH